MTRPATATATAFTVAAIGIASYSGMDAVIKGLAIADGAYSAVLWRSLAGVVLLAPVFVAQRRTLPSRAAMLLHVARGSIGGGSVLLFFWGLVRVPMAQGIALTFLAPLIALYLAAVLLGETIGRGAIAGSLVASLGVLVIAAGQVDARASTDAVLGAVAIVVASILYAGSLILLRRQAQVAEPIEVALFTSIVLSALLLAGAPWFAHVPASAQLPEIIAAAALGSVSAVLVAWAYARAETQVLAPVEYSAFVWAAILGWLVFGERVSAWTVAGALRGKPVSLPLTEAAA